MDVIYPQQQIMIVYCCIAGTVCLITWYIVRNKPTTPELHHVGSDLHNYVIKTKPKFTAPYCPPFWLQNNHIQTIVATFITPVPLTFRRETITLEDGGELALDWVDENVECLEDSCSIVIILPGLTSTREDMARLCRLSADRGYRVVVFNKRGHGDTLLKTPKMQGFGQTADFRHCVKHIHDKFPSAKLIGVGFSAGSGLLASYLGEYGKDCILTTGVCACPGYNALELFGKGMNSFYESQLISNLHKIIRRNENVLSSVIDLEAIYNSKTFAAFDMLVYCKMHGHVDNIDYWKHNDPMRDILDVKIPVLCINSLDDPICAAHNIPFDLFKSKEEFMLVTTHKGGHCGFLEGWDLNSWAEIIALDYVDAVLDYLNNKQGSWTS